MKPFEFWFSIGSTYSYLTVCRIDTVAREAGVEVTWKPFSVRALMQEMNNVPFAGKPAKERYMWRDLQRRAARLGIAIELPVSYPLDNFDRANRIAILAASEGWCEDYVRRTYHYWMQEGMPAGGEPNLARSLKDVGQSFDRVIEHADTDSIHTDYEEATATARSLGIFGSPSFIVDNNELFWGDDRLEDAIDYWRQSSSAN